MVDHTLSVVDIIVCSSTTSRFHVGWVGDVEENDTSITRHQRSISDTSCDITSNGANAINLLAITKEEEPNETYAIA